jgi:hypothetical protein
MAKRGTVGELQQRVCRVCQQTYDYPLPRSLATRFHCEVCVALPSQVRAVFERQNRRIKELTIQVDELRRALDHRPPAKPGE